MGKEVSLGEKGEAVVEVGNWGRGGAHLTLLNLLFEICPGKIQEPRTSSWGAGPDLKHYRVMRKRGGFR